MMIAIKFIAKINKNSVLPFPNMIGVAAILYFLSCMLEYSNITDRLASQIAIFDCQLALTDLQNE